MACVACGSEWVHRDGQTRHGQRWRCFACCRRYTARSGSAFSRHRFPDAVIGLAVRWYVRFRLSYAHVVKLLAERGSPSPAARSIAGCSASYPRCTSRRAGIARSWA